MAEMNILILGGTRFIGPALTAKLLSRMKDAARLTCFHRGRHMMNVPAAERRISHIIGDRHNEQEVAALFRHDWDTVIDLSGTDEQMILTALRQARDRCGRYVFISSSSVYTPAGTEPHREDEPLLKGTGEAYAAAKIQGEQLLREWFSHYTVIRPSKIYGPGNYYFSEMDFLEMIKARRVIPLLNDPLLHFTYIDDLAEAICALMDKDGVFNAAGPEPARLSRFIRLIGNLHGIPVDFSSDRNSDVPFTGLSDRILDLSAAKEAAGWEPVISLEEGLQRTFFPTAQDRRP